MTPEDRAKVEARMDWFEARARDGQATQDDVLSLVSQMRVMLRYYDHTQSQSQNLRALRELIPA